jgi:hypothetical protein
MSWLDEILVLLAVGAVVNVGVVKPGRRDDVGQSPPKTGGKATRSTNAASTAASADTIGVIAVLVRPCRGCRRVVRRSRVRGTLAPKGVTKLLKNLLRGSRPCPVIKFQRGAGKMIYRCLQMF